MSDAVLVAAQVLSGLLAGVYLAFVVAVMPALGRLDDGAFADAMNRINEVILNPAFLLLFAGTPLACCSLLAWERGPAAIVAAVTAVLAVVITVVVHVPRNEALARDRERGPFESSWNAWHLVRTAVCVACFAATLFVP